MHPKVVVKDNQSLYVTIDKRKAADVFERICLVAANDAKNAVKKGGRTGRFRDDGSTASRIGEAPHTETGELVRSISVRRRGNNVSLISKAEHAAVHEFGDRPFMRPALENAIREMGHLFADVLKVEAK